VEQLAHSFGGPYRHFIAPGDAMRAGLMLARDDRAISNGVAVALLVAEGVPAEGWPALLGQLWPSAVPERATCLVAPLSGEAVLLGRFQCKESVLASAARDLAVARRATGGRALLAGAGSLSLALVVPTTGALLPGAVALPTAKIVNRLVRPVLGALGALGVSAGWFGRDFIACARRPVACVSWDALASGAVLFEAQIGFTRALLLPRALAAQPGRAQPEPAWASLSELAPERVPRMPELEAWLAALSRGFAERLGAALEPPRPIAVRSALAAGAAPPWTEGPLPPLSSRPREVPIGFVEARVALDALASRRLGAPVLSEARLLGDFQADSTTLAALEASLRGCPASLAEVGLRIDAHFGPGGRGTMVGLKSLSPLAEAVVEAAGGA